MSNPMTFVFLRHVQAAGEDENASLSEVGQRKLEQVIPILSKYPFSRIYSSDLWRAVQPAQAFARSLGVPFQPSSALREIRAGIEIPRPASDTHNREDVHAFEQRVAKAIDDIVDQNEQNEKTHVLLVAHSGTIRAAVRYLLELPLPSLELPSLGLGGLVVLARDDAGKWHSQS